jgi:hypothetical protein
MRRPCRVAYPFLVFVAAVFQSFAFAVTAQPLPYESKAQSVAW